MKEFVRLDHFWGKNNFFEKNFVVEWFQRRDWAIAFKLGGMVTYIWGYGLLKKNYKIFVKIMAICRKLDFTIVLEWQLQICLHIWKFPILSQHLRN